MMVVRVNAQGASYDANSRQDKNQYAPEVSSRSFQAFQADID